MEEWEYFFSSTRSTLCSWYHVCVEAWMSLLSTSLPQNAAMTIWCHANAHLLLACNSKESSIAVPATGMHKMSWSREKEVFVMLALAVSWSNKASKHFTSLLQQCQSCHKTFCFVLFVCLLVCLINFLQIKIIRKESQIELLFKRPQTTDHSPHTVPDSHFY